MNIGYVYGFDSFPCAGGGAIHVHNLIAQLTGLGCRIHTFEPESDPVCSVYPVDEKGVDAFLSKIDLLYMRMDGWYLSQSPLKLKCMDKIGSKPLVWEINSSAEELVIRNGQSSDASRHKGLLERIQSFRRMRRLKAAVRKDEQLRCSYARDVSAACCVSSALMGYAQKDLKIDRCRVIPNGSDPDFFSPSHKDDSLFSDYRDCFKVIYAGDSRWPWQGFPIIVELADYALERDPEILFVVLDNSPHLKKIDKKNILLFNQVPYDEVPKYMASADACLCLYGDFSWSHLGFHLSPLKLFDYMASGKPVIGSKMGQIAEVIDDGKDGFLTSNAVSEIYQTIAMVKKDPDLAEKAGQRTRQKIINELSWNHTARHTYSVFQSVLDQQGP
ncbi:glycosyltransferase [uncultured Desulfosarcina sp.]|uniref:glycosyltransferase n=1 Tax=uncultured Desulfosarcina sp. TaxID=218289 RepID=UPI0029C8A8A6|nr:glycosyltransferase [uncultured Desulfosarcina sp.]